MNSLKNLLDKFKPENKSKKQKTDKHIDGPESNNMSILSRHSHSKSNHDVGSVISKESNKVANIDKNDNFLVKNKNLLKILCNNNEKEIKKKSSATVINRSININKIQNINHKLNKDNVFSNKFKNGSSQSSIISYINNCKKLKIDNLNLPIEGVSENTKTNSQILIKTGNQFQENYHKSLFQSNLNLACDCNEKSNHIDTINALPSTKRQYTNIRENNDNSNNTIDLNSHKSNNNPCNESMSLFSTSRAHEDNVKPIKNCENFVRKIGEKIKDLKVNLIKEDLQYRINLNKMIEKTENMFKIFHFIGGDLYGNFTSCKKIKNSIQEKLLTAAGKISNDFDQVYKKYFKVLSRVVVFEKTNNKKLKVDLILKAQINLPSEYFDNTFIISEVSKFEGDTRSFKNMYKFDYIKKMNKKIWLMREFTYV